MGPGTAAIATWRELAASLAGLARSIRAELCRDGLDEPSTDAAAQDLVCRWFAARLLNGEGPSAGGCVPRTGPVPLPPAARELRERAWGLLTRVDREAILRDFEGQRPGADPAIHFYEEFLAAYDPDRRMRQGVFYTPRPVVRFILHAVHERLRSEFGLAGGLADVRPRRDLFPAPQGALHPDAPFVQILDLAAGTGAFLVEAIDIIHRTLRVQWRAAGWSEGRIIDLWRDYVPRHLLPRLHGLELMPAACTLANLNLSLKLRATGYAHPGELAVVRPGDSLKRLLTGAGAVSSTPVSGEPGGQDARPPGRAGRRCRGAGILPASWAEARNSWTGNGTSLQAESRCHAGQRNGRPAFTVILGNPPYAARPNGNEGPLDALMADYRAGLEETNLNALCDDYVRFFRLAHALIVEAGAGVIGMVTNHSFLEGTSHRRMRELLHRDFDRIEVLDLHGNVMRRAEAPAGVIDQSVFDIQQGVAISILSRSSAPRNGKPRVRRADLWGPREQKLQRLAAASGSAAASPPGTGTPIEWRPIPCTGPHFLFLDAGGEGKEYLGWTPLTEIFEVFSCGIKFRKDGLLIKNHFAREDAERMLADVAVLSDHALTARYGFRETADWRLEDKRPLFADWRPEDIIEVTYRPFDIRYAFYPLDHAGRIIVRGDSRVELMRHMLAMPNVGLLFNRQVVGKQVTHFLVSRRPVSHGTFYLGNKGQDYFAPLYLLGPDGRPRPNLKAEFVAKLTAALQSPAGEGATGLRKQKGRAPCPGEVLHYLYAIVHSPTYRTRYAGQLKLDFPRVPMPPSAELFEALADLGADLVGLHLLEDDYGRASWNQPGRAGPWSAPLCSPAGQGPAVVAGGYPKYKEGRVYLNAACWLDGVAEDVWTFEVGGYQVCRKWLQDRRGRALSEEEIRHYARVVRALDETRRLMNRIDATVKAHGGFEAFRPAPVRS